MPLFFRIGWVLLLSLLVGWVGSEEAYPENSDLLDLASGAVVLSYSSQYAKDWKAQWTAVALLDGTSELGWCSENKASFPHRILIELPAVHRLETLTLDNTSAQEGSNPGISARKVSLSVSTEGSDKGFHEVVRGEVARGDRTTFTLEKAVKARWIEVSILSNWGDTAYTELMELEATGTLAETAPAGQSATGVYETNYGKMVLEQSGDTVRGCYFGGMGGFTGSADGRVMRLEWRQEKDNGSGRSGPVILVMTADGNAINGLWYGSGSKSSIVGPWFGSRVDAEADKACPVEKEGLAKALENEGRATLYGILFNLDSAKLKEEADPTLEEVLEILSRQKALRVVLKGHTDSTGGESHNLNLSQERANAVVAWLVARGIDAQRLEALGQGETAPVADNETPQGRQLNRRVEIEVVQ